MLYLITGLQLNLSDTDVISMEQLKNWLTPELIVSCGLVISLIIAVVTGADAQLTGNIASGLVGWLGREGLRQTTK